jgi:ribosome-binding protein aMBF1 (putative translation factor)
LNAPCPARKTSGSWVHEKEEEIQAALYYGGRQLYRSPIREQRSGAGLSRVALGEKVGVSFQQIQKYECGVNRVTAARLFEICEAVDVSLASMFERKLKA